jgi:hypothetical protein
MCTINLNGVQYYSPDIIFFQVWKVTRQTISVVNAVSGGRRSTTAASIALPPTTPAAKLVHLRHHVGSSVDEAQIVAPDKRIYKGLEVCGALESKTRASPSRSATKGIFCSIKYSTDFSMSVSLRKTDHRQMSYSGSRLTEIAIAWPRKTLMLSQKPINRPRVKSVDSAETGLFSVKSVYDTLSVGMFYLLPAVQLKKAVLV